VRISNAGARTDPRHGAAQSPATLAIGVEIQVCWLKAV
jgi:hypothetical protein